MTSAVLVSLGAAAPGDALLPGIERLRTEGFRVVLVSRVAPVRAVAAAVHERVPVGRAAGGPFVAGKVKLDPHRLPGAGRVVFGRRTRALVRDGDVLVAVDAAALPAVWLAARINRRAVAVNGLPAALTRVTS